MMTTRTASPAIQDNLELRLMLPRLGAMSLLLLGSTTTSSSSGGLRGPGSPRLARGTVRAHRDTGTCSTSLFESPGRLPYTELVVVVLVVVWYKNCLHFPLQSPRFFRSTVAKDPSGGGDVKFDWTGTGMGAEPGWKAACFSPALRDRCWYMSMEQREWISESETCNCERKRIPLLTWLD
eukprot:3738626-Rhodomonas_salina.1